jgi:CHASE3 domain sensor protein
MSEERQSRSTRRLILVGLLVPCLLVSIPAILAYRAQQQLFDSFRWVSHTLEVQHQLQHLRSLLTDAETGMRGFMLSSRDNYLEPYRGALAQLPRETALLRTLTADNPVQQDHLRHLEPLVADKLGLMAETIALQQRGDRDAALKLFGTDRGRQSMDAIRARIDLMAQEETRLLAIRQDLVASRSRFGTGLASALVALNLFFAVAILILVHRLARLQNLVTICAWSRTVEYEGEWLSFEEYLDRRFNLSTSHGISPAEAEKAFGPAART